MLWLVLLSAAPAQDASRGWLEQARTAFQRQQLAAARTAAAKALALSPRLAEAEVILGLIATLERNPAEAEAHFARAVSFEPANYRTHAYLGATLLAQGRRREAEASFRRVLALQPGNAAAHYNLGTIALAEGRAQEAQGHFRAVLRGNTGDVPALMGLLDTQAALGQSAAALTTARRLAASVPPSELAPLAARLVSAGLYAPAVPLLERLVQAEPQSLEARYNLGLACFRAGLLDAARAALQPLLSSAQSADAYHLLGSVEEKAGRPAEALAAFAAAAKADASEDHRIAYGSALVRRGVPEQAAPVFQEAAAAFPESTRARLGLASAQYLAGQYGEAAATLLETVRLHPGAAPAYDLLGRAFESAPAELQPAILTVYWRYLQRQPNDAAAFTHFAAMLQGPGRPASAEYGTPRQHLERALALDAKFAPAHYQLGVLAQQDGRWSDAERHLERAVQLEPTQASAHYRLAAVYQKLGKREQATKAQALFQRWKAAEAAAERSTFLQPLQGDR